MWMGARSGILQLRMNVRVWLRSASLRKIGKSLGSGLLDLVGRLLEIDNRLKHLRRGRGDIPFELGFG